MNIHTQTMITSTIALMHKYKYSGHTHPQEVQLREAAMYGLVEWIPQLVQEGADTNAADMV